MNVLGLIISSVVATIITIYLMRNYYITKYRMIVHQAVENTLEDPDNLTAIMVKANHPYGYSVYLDASLFDGDNPESQTFEVDTAIEANNIVSNSIGYLQPFVYADADGLYFCKNKEDDGDNIYCAIIYKKGIYDGVKERQ